MIVSSRSRVLLQIRRVSWRRASAPQAQWSRNGLTGAHGRSDAKGRRREVLVPSRGSRIHYPGPFTFSPSTMRNKRVVIYGGTDLDKQPMGDFVSALAYALLGNDSILLATGGFARRAASAPHAISTDVAAADGARKFAA